ncbi:MAG: tetratricopeptide repeat protein [Ghiorsea sp.]
MNFMRSALLICLLLSITSCQSTANKKVEEDNTKRAVFHYRLGIDALHKGILPRAFEELLLSDKINPDQPNTLDAIGHAWRMRGNLKQAQKYYEHAIDKGAGAATYNNYGNLLVELGDFHLAITYLNIALDDPRYPNQAFSFTNLGDAYLGLNRFEDAISAYRKAHMLAPQQNYAQLREAEAYIKFDRLNYAQALYETILRKSPGSQAALAGLIKLLKNSTQALILEKYINTFIETTANDLEKAWAKDELSQLLKQAKE